MQDEVREKSVALVIRTGKNGARLTSDLLKWAMRRYLEQARKPQVHHGKQSVRQLIKQNVGAQNLEITGKNIGSFVHIARKYGVDFALKKDPAQRRYLVFFKARDADVLSAAFAEYAAKSMHREKKLSLRQQLEHFKAQAQENARDMVKERAKGGIER